MLSTVVDLYSSRSAEELVVRCLIRVLKTSPTTHVIHENCLVGLLSLNDILEQLRQSSSSPNFQSALGLIKVGLADLEAVFLCVISNPCALKIQ